MNNDSEITRSRPRPSPRMFEKWVPWMIPMIVIVNVVLFVITMYVNNCPMYSYSVTCFPRFLGRFSFQPLKENPLLGPSAATLREMGALEIDMVVHRHQAWRLFSSMWLHAGVIHVLANMLSLVFIGIRLEQEFGFVKIGLLYITSGFGASILSALFLQSTISVGASGALFGLLGAMLSELLTNWTIYANKVAALLTLVFIIIINLAVGILPHVDNFAHIGGFITGFLLGFVLLMRPQFGWVSPKHSRLPIDHAQSKKPKHKPYQYVLWVAAALFLTLGIAIGLVSVLRGANGNEYCSWCHYLTCFPTSKWSCKPHQVFCESIEDGNKLNLTCMDNGKSRLYPVIEGDSYRVQQLCTQLCS